MGVRLHFKAGAWWVFVCHRRKRTAKKIGTDKKVALRIKAEIEERLSRSDLLLPQPERVITLKAYSEAHLQSVEQSLKGSTVRFYRDNLENHVYPVLGDRNIREIGRADVKALVIAVSGKGLRPNTITGVLRTLSTVLSEAVEDGHLPANPAQNPGRLRKRLRDPNAPTKHRVDPYTREDVERLLETARRSSPEWHPFLMCAVRTGMRLGELRALQWGDIDWHGRFIHVSRNYVEGKFTVPKSGQGRNVDMSLQLRRTLRLWRWQLHVAWLRREKARPALVFPSAAGTPLDDSNIRKAVRRIAQLAEVRVRRKIVHVFRHTFGSLLIQQGESLAYVKEQMGHSSIAVTVDNYGHLLPGGNRDAVDRLDDATVRNQHATTAVLPVAVNAGKSLNLDGEPPRNRTENPQIKSRLRPVESPKTLGNRKTKGGRS